jgi:putative phosphoribosyl transferase
MTELKHRSGLHEAKRKRYLALKARIVEAGRRRNRRRRKRLQRLRAQPEFPAPGGEYAVGARHRPRGADTAAGRHFKVTRVNPLFVMRQQAPRVRYERPVQVRTGVERSQCQLDRESHDPLDQGERHKRRESRIRNRLRQADVEVQSQRRGDLVLEELPEAAVPRIDPAQQLTLVKSEADGVVRLLGSRLPGRALARHDRRQPVKVGAAEVAAALDAPLDLVLVRKIGLPAEPELAMGAVVDGAAPIMVRNEDIIRCAGIEESEFKAVCDRELAEIERRRERYLGDLPRVDVAGRTVIVIDDGIATGATIRAALRAIRMRKPGRLVLAVPVASTDALTALRQEADHVVCLENHEPFGAIGIYYADFRQTTDQEVIDAMARFSPGDGTGAGRSAPGKTGRHVRPASAPRHMKAPRKGAARSVRPKV